MKNRNISVFCRIGAVCLAVLLISGYSFVRTSRDANADPAESAATETGNVSVPDDYAELSRRAAAVLNTLSANEGEVVFSEGASASEQSLSDLKAAIADIRRMQAKVAFVVVDMRTGKAFACNTGWKHTPQSCIKAPFITSVLVENPDAFEEDKELIEPLIRVSDGECYNKLYKKHGNGALIRWASGVGLSADMFDKQYPKKFTVIDFAKLWTLMYAYLNSPDAPREFVSYFRHTKFSALDLELGDKYSVQSKAGWENGVDSDNEEDDDRAIVVPRPKFVDGDPSNDETSTNDAGIVYSADGEYICVIFSTVISNPPVLRPLVAAIDRVHSDMVRVNESTDARAISKSWEKTKAMAWMGRNNKVEPLSDKTQRKLGILQNYYRVDMQKRVVVVPLHYDKASDIICEDLTDAKRPLIRNDVLERISDIEATIPDEFSIYISLKVDDCEGYDYGYLMSGL